MAARPEAQQERSFAGTTYCSAMQSHIFRFRTVPHLYTRRHLHLSIDRPDLVCPTQPCIEFTAEHNSEVKSL